MTIDAILEQNPKTTEFSLSPKVSLVVHCGCGADYTVREKFPSFTENHGEVREFTRSSKCEIFPGLGARFWRCWKTNYIKYNIQRYGSPGNGGYKWDISPVIMPE